MARIIPAATTKDGNDNKNDTKHYKYNGCSNKKTLMIVAINTTKLVNMITITRILSMI